MLSNIIRRKNLQGSDQRKSSEPQQEPDELCEKFKNLKLWKEVESLKTDKNALMQELVKLRQYLDAADNTLVILRDRIQGMESTQHQVLSFLVMAMQSPGFLVQLLQLKENNWCVAETSNMLEEVTEIGEPVASDNMIVRYKQLDDGSQPESGTSDEMKDMFMNVDFMKILMEENHPPFIPPSLHDYGEWEKLLLGNTDNTQQDKEEETGMAMEVDPTVSGSDLDNFCDFELLLQQMDKSKSFEIEPTDNGRCLEKSQDIELLGSESDDEL